MIVFLLLIVVLLIGLTAAALLGRIGGFMAEPTSTHAFSGVPTGSLSADDVEGLHFDQALRGYRMDQVDETIDALAERLRQLEAAAAPLPSAGAPLPAAGAPPPPSGDSPSESLGPERE